MHISTYSHARVHLDQVERESLHARCTHISTYSHARIHLDQVERERESLHVRCKHIGTHSHARIHLDQMQTGKQCVNTRDFLETNRPELRLAYSFFPMNVQLLGIYGY